MVRRNAKTRLGAVISHYDVAQILGISEQAVAQAEKRALKKCRKFFKVKLPLPQ